MKLIYGAGFTDEERIRYKDIIYRNCLDSVRALISGMGKLHIEYEHGSNAEVAKTILKIPEQQIVVSAGSILTNELGRDIKSLWQDAGIQKCFQQRSRLQLIDSADYYLNDIERITSPNYDVSEQDILRSRSKTVGIVEEDFLVDKFKFKTIDVGGQRNERRKWIHTYVNFRH
jgi:hypothetical protein